MRLAPVHHDPDDQHGADQHHRQHREAGDGRQLPHVRRLVHVFTCRSHRDDVNAPLTCSRFLALSRGLQVLQEGVLGYFLHDSQGTHTSRSELQNSELLH